MGLTGCVSSTSTGNYKNLHGESLGTSLKRYVVTIFTRFAHLYQVMLPTTIYERTEVGIHGSAAAVRFHVAHESSDVEGWLTIHPHRFLITQVRDSEVTVIIFGGISRDVKLTTKVAINAAVRLSRFLALRGYFARFCKVTESQRPRRV
jgi:hypothetical protein